MRPRGAPLANLPNVDVNTGAACRGWARAVKDIARQSFEVSPTIRSSLKVALGGGRTDVLPDSVSDPAYATTKGRRLDRHDGAAERIRLVGGEAGPGTQPALRVEWPPALQLPALIVRRAKDGSAVRVELAQRAVAPPADWRLPDAERTLECARIDAAGVQALAAP